MRFSPSNLTLTNPFRLVPVIARLQQVQIVANEISAKSKVYEASLDSLLQAHNISVGFAQSEGKFAQSEGDCECESKIVSVRDKMQGL